MGRDSAEAPASPQVQQSRELWVGVSGWGLMGWTVRREMVMMMREREGTGRDGKDVRVGRQSGLGSQAGFWSIVAVSLDEKQAPRPQGSARNEFDRRNVGRIGRAAHLRPSLGVEDDVCLGREVLQAGAIGLLELDADADGGEAAAAEMADAG